MIIEEMIDRIAQGGPVMVPLAAVSLVAWAIIAERWLWARRQKEPPGKEAEVSRRIADGDLRGAFDACYGSSSISMLAARRFLGQFMDAPAEAAPHLARESSLRELGSARRGLPLVAALAAAAPLLGLLGTVLGMIQTFDAITLHGTGNPRVLAEGISEALLTTQAGLIVALPVLLAHGRLRRRCDLIVQRSEEFLSRVVSDASRARSRLDPGNGGEGGR